MTSLLDKFLDTLLKVLPTSPFAGFIDDFSDLPYLGWLNWFIPIGTFLKIFIAYLSAIALFYAYMLIARWVKLIGD